MRECKTTHQRVEEFLSTGKITLQDLKSALDTLPTAPRLRNRIMVGLYLPRIYMDRLHELKNTHAIAIATSVAQAINADFESQARNENIPFGFIRDPSDERASTRIPADLYAKVREYLHFQPTMSITAYVSQCVYRHLEKGQ